MQPTPDLIAASADPTQFALAQKRSLLQTQIKNDINWFYWIAGLSLINSGMYLFGGGLTFVVGLAITQIVDGIASGFAKAALSNGQDIVTLVHGLGLVINFVIAGLFILFGFLGRKHYRGWIIAGIVLYGLDALLCLFFKDWMGAGFHAFALIFLIRGLRAVNELKKLEPAPAPFIPPTVSPL